MCDRGYARASQEYESRLSEPSKSEEEILEEIEEREFWQDYYEDQKFEEMRVREYEEKNCE